NSSELALLLSHSILGNSEPETGSTLPRASRSILIYFEFVLKSKINCLCGREYCVSKEEYS
ncbi:hypothetical protein STEG23_002538, partial [Scotinomys teguina]